ncbi:MAG: hypothetical protein ACAH06_11320 [Methylophilaceae bacterium]|jgi:hypothetical protein|uniref:hypothetical protein n=1 Tax=Methylobacillus sp. MM3 TaxID=1848039 RepID=UPI001041FF91|nr:hypothetical protein [Methylobacillus sp. MM3]
MRPFPMQAMIFLAPLLGSAGTLAAPPPASLTDLSTLADNTARDLGAYDCANVARDGISCRTITSFSGFTYDAKRRQMLMFGGGHSATMRDDVDEFSFKTLKWKSASGNPNVSTTCDVMWVSGPEDNFDEVDGRWISTGHATSRHTYDLRVVTRDGAELVILKPGDIPGNQCTKPRYKAATSTGRIAHYDIDTKTWRFTVKMPWNRYSAAELDPVSGRIIVLDAKSGIWSYDPVAGMAPVKLLSLKDANMGYANNLVYFPPNDRFYYFHSSAGRVWEVSLTRSGDKVTQAAVKEVGSGLGPKLPETGFAYDAASKVIGGGVHKDQFHAFDPATGEWTATAIRAEGGGKIGTQAYHALDYDPVANVYIFISNSASGFRVWAYRHKAAAALAP